MNENEYWQYDYFENGRLKQKDYKEGSGDFHQHYIYEYDNGGKTKIESYWTSWETQGQLLRKRTTYQYDDTYRLSSVLTESFSVEGTLTNSTMTLYAYTQSNNEESEITQTLVDGEWINTNIQRYLYDESDRIIEQQNGSWLPESNDWDITRKIVFEYSNDNQTYIVSFYKKNNEVWGWDMFNNQCILFDPLFKIQQRSLRYYMYEDMHEPAKINQFEITFEQTVLPNYMDVSESQQDNYNVFPNPGRESISVKAPLENAVVRFYDLQGRLLEAKPFDFQTDINAGDWAPGLYLWEIWSGPNREASGKWLKE